MFTSEDENLFFYNGMDNLVTAHAWLEFKDEIDPNFTGPYRQTMDLLEPLMAMAARGLLINKEALNETRGEVRNLIDEKQQALDDLCGRPLNVNSPKDCQQYFYVEKKIKPYYNNGRVTTDDKAMARIARGTAARQGLPEARLVQEVRAHKKLVSTYLDIETDADGRFRCSFNPRGTKFGRLSTGKTIYDTGMNLQNLPPAFRKFIIPDEGYLFYEIDKKGAEWVVVAYACGDPEMLRVVEEGIDPHTHTAHLMTGVPKEIIVEEDKLIGHSTDPHIIGEIRNRLRRDSAIANALDKSRFLPRNLGLRQCGKKSNHGLNYDEGYKQFALINEIPEKEAKYIVDLYKNRVYPGVPQWYQKVQSKLRHDRTLENCFGRKCRFLDHWDDQLFKAAYSFEPQSTVADIINRGIIYTYNDRQDLQAYNELLGQIHDSLIGQIPIQDARSVATALIRTGEALNPEMTIHGRTFKIANEIKVSLSSWGELQEIEYTTDIAKMTEQIRGITES